MTQMRKVVWVTGGSSGIGLAAATHLAREGHTTVLSGRDEGRLGEAVGALRSEGLDAHSAPVDVTDPAAVQLAVAKIVEDHGQIDALVANAGANVGARAWGEVSASDFARLMDLNVDGVFHCVDAALPHMRAVGGGVVVVVASWAGNHISAKPGPGYTASKHAAVALAESLNAAEFGNGIRACALCPGEVATPAMAKRKNPPSAAMLKRMLQPDDIARTIGFIVDTPAHVAINQITISPTWNGAYGAPAIVEEAKP